MALILQMLKLWTMRSDLRRNQAQFSSCIQIQSKGILTEKARAAKSNPIAFLEIEDIFGDLIKSERFSSSYTEAYKSLMSSGVKMNLEIN